jgi:hypothetical protein
VGPALVTSNRLEDVAIRVAAALGVEDCVLIGGLAVGAHGYVRATTDVDFVVRDLASAGKRLLEQGLPVERLHGDFTCLRGMIGAVRFDVLPPLVPIRWDRAITVSLEGRATIRVVDLESLIRLKLRAGGPKDLMDVAALVLRHPEHRERAQELAVAYRIGDALDLWLRDPRLQAELGDARSDEAERRAQDPSSTPATDARRAGKAVKPAKATPRPAGARAPRRTARPGSRRAPG